MTTPEEQAPRGNRRRVDEVRFARAEERRFCRLLACSLMLNRRLFRDLSGKDLDEDMILKWLAAAVGADLELVAWREELLDKVTYAESGRELLRAWDMAKREFS